MNLLSIFAQSNTSEDASVAAAAGIGIMMLFFWLVIMAVAIAGLVLWIMSLIHVIQHNDVKDRVMWILIILLVGTIGGVIYYFAVKRPYDRGGMREITPQTPSS